MDLILQRKRLLNRPEAADYLNIALRTLDEKTAIGEISVCRIGRAVRYRAAALDDFIEANETRVTPKRRRVARGKTSTGATA
jgi:excisionase family DNA binding protein